MDDREAIIVKEDRKKLEAIKKKYNNSSMSDSTASKIKRLEVTNKGLKIAASICGVITFIDWIIPDGLILVDEVILTGITTLLGVASGIVDKNIKSLATQDKSDFTIDDVQKLTDQMSKMRSKGRKL